jgi:hypothetical protein
LFGNEVANASKGAILLTDAYTNSRLYGKLTVIIII